MGLLSRLGALFASISLLAFTPLLFAQDNETAPPATDTAESQTAEEAKSSSSQEVEINEDTYRQFMELKDANRQGDIIPETAFKPGSGLQKLDKLPEESQKHLRNELREIIVQGDPWQPGDEAADYPYTPSAAASMNPALQKQELEAWGELVDSYNQREAQIYADRAGNRAAMNPHVGEAGQPGDGADKEGKDGEDKVGVPGQPSEQEGNPENNDTAGAFSPDAVHDPNAQNASGVSQNALEFLQGLGGNGDTGTGGQTATPQGSEQLGPAGTQGQAQTGQQDAARQAGNAAATTQSPSASSETSTAGTSQSAMDYLNQAAVQAGSTGGSNPGSSTEDGSQGENAQSAASTAQADGQQAGQGNEQATAQNSGQGAAQGQEQADGEQAEEQGEGQAGSQTDRKTLTSQQSETAVKTVSVPIPDDEFTFSSSAPEQESTVGSTQNALEFLQGGSGQTGDGAGDAAETVPPPVGTLNIQDLLNAKGVGGATESDPEASASGSDKQVDETKTGKDGGGR